VRKASEDVKMLILAFLALVFSVIYRGIPPVFSIFSQLLWLSGAEI
jgi:hypothetical protein